LGFGSCAKEATNQEIVDDQLSQALFIQKRIAEIKANPLKTKVVHASLEEINQVLRKNSLKEFTQEEMDVLKAELRLRSTYPCAVWNSFGDWNGDGTFDTGDIADVNVWLSPSGTCACSSVDLWTCGCSTPHDDFAALTYLQNGSGYFLMNSTDIRIAGAYLNNLYTCY
jgi:hypothetical protein